MSQKLCLCILKCSYVFGGRLYMFVSVKLFDLVDFPIDSVKIQQLCILRKTEFFCLVSIQVPLVSIHTMWKFQKIEFLLSCIDTSRLCIDTYELCIDTSQLCIDTYCSCKGENFRNGFDRNFQTVSPFQSPFEALGSLLNVFYYYEGFGISGRLN